MPTVNCPHCGSENRLSAAFCEKCGGIMADISDQELDAAATASETTSSQINVKLARKLREQKKASAVSKIILAAAILMATGSLVSFFFAFNELSHIHGQDGAKYVLVILINAGGTGMLAMAFTGLALWARKSPAPAAFITMSIHIVFQLPRLAIMMSNQSEDLATSLNNVGILILMAIALIILVMAVIKSFLPARLLTKQPFKALQLVENPAVLGRDRLGDVG